jgi:serine protease Do
VKLDANFDLSTANRLKIGRLRGARIVEVYPKTPAAEANLQFDDVIISFNGIQILDENHLINLVSLTPVNERAKLDVIRNGHKIALEIILRDRSELEQRSEAPTRPGMGIEVEQMGLTLHKVDRTIADQLGFNETAHGLLVLRIAPDCPLAPEIQLYDLIEEVARTPVATVEDLKRILEQRTAESSMLIRVRRTENGVPQSRVIVWRR